MNCPKCNKPLTSGSLFCPGCGTPVSKLHEASAAKEIPTAPISSEQMQRTMTIPVIRDVPKSSRTDSPIEGQPQQRDYNPPSTTRRNLLIFFIVFFSVVLIGLLVFIGFMMSSSVATREHGTDRDDTSVVRSEEKHTPSDNKSTENEADKSDDKEDESAKKVKKSKKAGGASNSKKDSGRVKVDTGFGFAYGVAIEDTKRDYTTLTSRDYSYKCDFPSDFEYEFDDGEEIRYAAADNTAYMDIGAGENLLGLTASEVKANTQANVDGTVTYEAIGDDWYAMSIEKDGVSYYQKCFVDEYIRYFEVVCPTEYVDVYDDYITEIEATFKRTE
ncbi:MAG: zinc ribbon domain-containing protein [Clostridia bacterium]|nr:zinc ribbon domain-containing protein [Clostridia bacterium]